jgi:hypothetical protein
LTAREQKGHFCAHFSRVAVSDFRSLRGDIVFRPLLARLSLAAKIPFQTRIGQADRKSARGEFTRRGCFTGSGISLPSLRRRRPGWARFAFKQQLVWTFVIALDLAVDLSLDLGKFFFDFDFTLDEIPFLTSLWSALISFAK